MKTFQKVVQELKELLREHRPGEALQLPPSLHTFEIKGRRVAYISAGLDHASDAASPVVLLHGFGGFFMDWSRVMAPLARQTRVFALDLPGWGFSDPDSARSMEDQVATLEAFLKHLGLKRAIVCGLSFGGAVAWAAGAMNTLNIKRLVLLNPMPPHPLRYLRSPIYKGIFFLNSIGPVGRTTLRFLNKTQYRLICRENLLNHRLLDTFYLDLAYRVIKQPKMASVLGAYAQSARGIDWNSWEHRLAGCRVPVSILQAKQDRLFSLESAMLLHHLIPTSELIEVDACGHAMVFDQHRRVSEFIARHITEGTHADVEKAVR